MMRKVNTTGGRLTRLSALSLAVAFAIKFVAPSQSDTGSSSEKPAASRHAIERTDRVEALAARSLGPSSWAELESSDYSIYAANLRRFGCPEQTIRDLVFMDLLSNTGSSPGDVAVSFAALFGIPLAEGLPAGLNLTSRTALPVSEENDRLPLMESDDTPAASPQEAIETPSPESGGAVETDQRVESLGLGEFIHHPAEPENEEFPEPEEASDIADVSANPSEPENSPDGRSMNIAVRELLVRLLQLARSDDPAGAAAGFKAAELASLLEANASATETELQNQYDRLLADAEAWLQAN